MRRYDPPMIGEVLGAWNGERDLSHRVGARLLAISGVLLSFTAIVFRALDDAGDWQFLTVRGTGAATAMAVVVLIRRRRHHVSLRAVDGRVGVAIVLLAAMNVCYITALARTTTATVTFLIAAGPIAAAGFGRLVLGERLTRTTVVAMATAGAGIAVMAAGGVDTDNRTGFLLAAILPVMLGAYTTLLRGAGNIDPVVPAFWSSSLLAAVAGTVATTEGGLAMSLRDLALGALAGVVLMGVALPLFNFAHRAVPAAQVPLLMMTELVLAPVWVWIWPGERPAVTTIIGGLVVIGAVIWQIRLDGTDDTEAADLSAPATT